MTRKILFLFFLLTNLSLTSCTTINLERKIEPPTKSFVKVHHKMTILECTKEYKKMCPVGDYLSMGSGIVIDLIEDQTIVVTAGHVCQSEVDGDKISSFQEKVVIEDHRGMSHEAMVIKASQDNSLGSVDMCALWVPTLKQKGVKFSMFRPRVGQELYYMGAPSGIYHPPVMPILTGIYSGQIDASNALISIPATGGSSGSAIMDLNNRIVGVLWAAHSFHHVAIMTNWDASAIFLYQVTEMYTGKSQLTLPPLKK